MRAELGIVSMATLLLGVLWIMACTALFFLGAQDPA